MGSELTVGDGRTLTAIEIKAQVQLIQEVMTKVMQGPSKENPNGVHYGKVPGCGDKLVLLKPGAEKLLSTFRLAVDPEIEDLSDSDCVRFRVKARITSMATGAFLGAGIGEGSSNEEKYKWRKAVCDEEFNETPEDRRREKWVAGYQDKKAYKVKQVRTNPSDVANTVLKMTKKRAQVDGVLTVTAASDIFTQDLEEDEGAKAVETETKPPLEKPVSKSAAATTPAKKELESMPIAELPKAAIESTIKSVQGVVESVDEKKFSSGKVKTGYKCGAVIIALWSSAIEGIAAGDTLNFIDVYVSEYNGSKQYTAKDVTVISKQS